MACKTIEKAPDLHQNIDEAAASAGGDRVVYHLYSSNAAPIGAVCTDGAGEVKQYDPRLLDDRVGVGIELVPSGGNIDIRQDADLHPHTQLIVKGPKIETQGSGAVGHRQRIGRWWKKTPASGAAESDRGGPGDGADMQTGEQHRRKEAPRAVRETRLDEHYATKGNKAQRGAK
jgi:hypothetical protein